MVQRWSKPSPNTLIAPPRAIEATAGSMRVIRGGAS